MLLYSVSSYPIKIFLIWLASFSVNQNTKQIPDNAHIKYSVVLKAAEFDGEDSFMPSVYLLKADISDKQKARIKRIDKNTWLQLLTNEDTDWAANILLYDIYAKDALLYTVIKSRSDWLKTEKDEDIEFWKKNLK